MKGRRVDDWGRVVYCTDAACELLFSGHDISGLYVDENSEALSYNRSCELFDKIDKCVSIYQPLETPPIAEHDARSSRWLLPDEFKDFDVKEMLLQLCENDEQKLRVEEEMVLYEKHGLIPVLRAITSMVAHWKDNGVVWGVGRGSSVASFVLYLIGVTRIDPMKYGLEITDFIR